MTRSHVLLIENEVVVRRTSEGFAVELHPASSFEIRRLLERLAEADRSAQRWLGGEPLPGR